MFSRKLTLELVWWAMTAVIVGVVMFPIWANFSDFKLNWTNIVFIAAFVTFTRYAFLLKYTFLADAEKLKIVFVLFTLAIVLAVSTQIQDFNVWLDNGNPDQLLANSPLAKREKLLNYIKTEFLFFAVAAIMSAVVLGGRLLVSIWRVRNRGKA